MNATNLANGERFSFTQEQFDFLASDLTTYPVARAVAFASDVAGGDLTAEIDSDSRDEIGDLVRAMAAISLSIRCLLPWITAILSPGHLPAMAAISR